MNDKDSHENNIFVSSLDNPQLVYAWRAPLRPYKRRGPLILRFFLSVALILSITLFFFGDRVLLLPIWALLFLFYILTITPPPDVENKITKFGIETATVTLRWEQISYFYITKRFNFPLLTIVSHPPYNVHTYIVLPDEEIKRHVIAILSEHTIFIEKPKKGVIEKLIDVLSTLVPEEEEGYRSTEPRATVAEPQKEESHVPQISETSVALPRQ